MPGFTQPEYLKGEATALTPGRLDLWIYCGDSFEQYLQFRYRNPDDSLDGPVDLTPYTVRAAEIRTIGMRDLIATINLIVPNNDLTAGDLILQLDWEDTKSLEIYPELEWDLSFQYISPYQTDSKVTVVKGKVYPLKEVTA